MRKLSAFLAACIIVAAIFPVLRILAAGNSVYLAQTAAGTGDGSSCGNAKAASYFNSSANWVTGTPTGTQIGPGTTVYLCGTITTNLTFQKNGAAGNPVVLDGTNATMSAFIDPNTSYWTIQNTPWSTSYATNSSTQAVIQTAGGAAFGLIQNNHIDVINSAQLIFFHGGTHDITILNNYLRITTTPGDGFDTDGVDTEGAYNVLIQGNYLAMNIGAGDKTCGGCHDDITQVWGSKGSTYNWAYKYNQFVQESNSTVTNNLSWCIFEQISAQNAGYWDLIGNVFVYLSGGSSGNGCVFDGNNSGMTSHIYNNTLYAASGSGNNLFNISGAGSYNLENNIVYSTTQGNALTGGVTFATRGHNLWFGPPSPSCVATEVCGTNPNFVSIPSLNFALQAGSAAIGLGSNFGSTYGTGLLPGATWPNPATASWPGGAWNAGAFTTSSAGSVTLSPSSNNFGSILVGASSGPQTFTLTNTVGSTISAITPTSTGPNAADFTVTNTGAGSCASGSLTTGNSCTVTVTFAPSATGSRTATLSISYSGGSGSPQTAALSGTGTAPVVSFAPTSLAFGNQVQGNPATKSVVLSNTGTGTLAISSISITGANAGDFTQSNNCASSVAVSGSCTINVTFTPSTTGARSAAISVADNAAGSPQTVALTGTGIAAVAGISFSPTSLAFGNQQVAVASAPLSTTVTNTGSATLTISAVTITGTNPSDFTRTSTCTNVAPSGTCTISVTFTPGATGARSASISVTDNAAGSPQSVPLTGTGTAAAVGLSPASLTFGAQTVGTTSAAQPVTLTNTGNATLTISSITVTGTNAGDFSQTNNCTSSVAIGGSCTINVKFSPSAGGSRTASVSIADSAVGSPQTVALTGTGVSTAPAVTFSPSGGLGFGNVIVNNSALVVQNIQNSGNATLTISSITVGGANASMFTEHTTCGGTLAAGLTCEISVVFTPTSVGPKSATVSVTDNAAGSPHVFNVTGTGITGTVPTVDQYGGLTSTPCASATGRFHIEQISTQWTFCTPLGNSFYLLGVYVVDYAGDAGYNTKITAKYGSPTAWAVPTLQRIQSWGFNSPYYKSNSIVEPFATSPTYPLDANGFRSIPVKMPFVFNVEPGLYGMENRVLTPATGFPTGQLLPVGSNVKDMAWGWCSAYVVPGGFTPTAGEPDFSDPNMQVWLHNYLQTQIPNAHTNPYVDYVLGVTADDGDELYGFGAGPDFPTVPANDSEPNLGYLTATMSPLQSALQMYSAVYTNQTVYTKQAWQTYLTNKYGTIAAMNAAWGSTYTTFGSTGTQITGEALGTGDGTTKTFAHTISHMTASRFTIQVLVNGVVAGADQGRNSFGSYNANGNFYGFTPSASPVSTLTGTMNYTTGAMSITFVTAPASGAAITVNYVQNGWEFGSGVMDEDCRASHRVSSGGWLTTDFTGLTGMSANIVADFNAFTTEMVQAYLQPIKTEINAQLPGWLFFGPDSYGSAQTTPWAAVLQGIVGNEDLVITGIGIATGPNYQSKMDFLYTNMGNMPLISGSYLTAQADSPYSAFPISGSFATQLERGQAYATELELRRASFYTANGALPFMGMNSFSFLDSAAQNANFGLVTLLDNAYNGVESVTGSVTCSAPLQAYTCGGEAGNYGDYTDCVTQANFLNTTCAGAGTPTVSLSTSSLSFANQIIGTASLPQVVMVTNTGTAALNISSVAITGANTGDFGQSNTCSLPVGPSASCTISVVFTPTAPGSRSASVTITDNASGSPHSVTLSGTGIAGPVVAPDPGMFSMLQ